MFFGLKDPHISAWGNVPGRKAKGKAVREIMFAKKEDHHSDGIEQMIRSASWETPFRPNAELIIVDCIPADDSLSHSPAQGDTPSSFALG